MLKKYFVFVLFAILAGCRSADVATQGGYDDMSTDYSEVSLGGRSNFRVGVLLPLSGSAAKQGQGLKNATMMALDDVRNPNLILQYYDTKSTPEGARIAIENALNQQSDLILGPLMSSEVRAISNQAIDRGVPVIAFSTNTDVLQSNIYTLGLLIDEQVGRVMSFAIEKGRSKFALLVPDNSTGVAVAKAAVKFAQKNNVQVVRIGFYPPETLDFAEIVKDIRDYDLRSEDINKQKYLLEQEAKNGNKEAEKKLKLLKTVYTTGEVDFDAILIPETGSRLKSAVSMFGYYDVSYPNVLFLGTSVWESTNLSKETTLYHSVYPVLSRIHNNYFNDKYESYFGAKPNQLFSFAYDGVALASALARKKTENLEQNITDADGYIGINGAFRIFNDGSNQHSLNIMEITSSGPQLIDSADKNFNTQPISAMPSAVPLEMPKIYGKDQHLAEKLLFGRSQDSFNGFIFRGSW